MPRWRRMEHQRGFASIDALEEGLPVQKGGHCDSLHPASPTPSGSVCSKPCMHDVSYGCVPGLVPLTNGGFELDGEHDVRGLGAGDSHLIAHWLSIEDADDALYNLAPCRLGGVGESAWMQMYQNNGAPFARLKFTQASLDGDNEPIYRYPANNQSACRTQPFSPTVEYLTKRAQSWIQQPLNHCVANLYRDHHDFIGPHSDKMLDIKHGSSIVSISLGVNRPIVLKQKDSLDVQQIVRLGHGSMFVMGPNTNHKWLHSIPSKQGDEGLRISLTLRQVDTFHNMRTHSIHGQGAKEQTLNWPSMKHDFEVVPTLAEPRTKPLMSELRSFFRDGGSTFECRIYPCTDIMRIKQMLQKLQLEFPDACHIPHAWILRDCAGVGRRKTRFGASSDGEPEKRLKTGKEGVLEPLLDAGLMDVVAFVVRHWDGVRLGVERLIRSYAQATAMAALPDHQVAHGAIRRYCS